MALFGPAVGRLEQGLTQTQPKLPQAVWPQGWSARTPAIPGYTRFRGYTRGDTISTSGTPRYPDVWVPAFVENYPPPIGVPMGIGWPGYGISTVAGSYPGPNRQLATGLPEYGIPSAIGRMNEAPVIPGGNFPYYPGLKEPTPVPGFGEKETDKAGSSKGGALPPGYQKWMSAHISPEAYGPWRAEFASQHEGMTPEQFYGRPGQTYEGGPGYELGEGLSQALDDLTWSQGELAKNGRPPTEEEWIDHWYSKRGGRPPEKPEKPVQSWQWTPPPVGER